MDYNFRQFVADLAVPANLSAWGPALALLEIGNFDGLVTFAATRGYAFTAADVRAYLAGRHAGPDRTGAPVTSMAAGAFDAAAPTNTYVDAWTRR